jgi:predicted acylesterase/phospholipase RssA/CRP-like cAMP-binding protein
MIFGKPEDINKSFIVNYAPIFANLRRREKRLILQKSEVMQYKKGNLIYRQGDPPDAFYCVISGRVKIFKLEDHKGEDLEHLTCGMYFGIISLLTAKTHSVNVEAVNDSLILRINKDNFDFIIKKVPSLAIYLSKTLSEQIRRRDYARDISKSNIIAIYSAVRGIGRTMYAINLTISLRKETKKKVLILDISQTGREIVETLNIKDAKEPLDLRHSILQKEAISKFIITDYDLDIDILNLQYHPTVNNLNVQISSILTLFTNEYQYIIVDLPVERNEVVFRTLAQSDSIHLITDYNVENLKSTRELMVDLFKNVEYPQEKIKIILNERKDSKKIPLDEIVRLLDHDVFADIPVFWEASDSINELSAKIVLTQPDSEYARAIRRIAREIGNMLVGLALGGGAAFGLAHIGVIKVLERENIPIDIVAGSSMGALIGAFWTSGKSGSEIENIIMEYNRKKIKVFGLLFDFCFPKASIAKGKNIAKFLRKHLGNKTFQDVKLPLKVIVCNLDKRERVVLDSDSLVEAVKRSIAIPGIFEPDILNGDLIIDGILDPVPIDVLIQAGVKKIIAVNVLPSPQDVQEGYKNYKYCLEKEKIEMQKQNLMRRILYKFRIVFGKMFSPNILDIMVNSLQAMEYVMAKQDCQKADIVINPVIPGTNWFEFFKVDVLIKKGEQETEKVIVQIKELVNR